MTISKKKLPAEQLKEVLKTLKIRFEKNMNRHNSLDWTKVEDRLEANAGKLWLLSLMEQTGGRARCSWP